MKGIHNWLALALLLTSCSRLIVSQPVSVVSPVAVKVGESSQLSGTGCGMTLWRKGQRSDRLLLFSGLQPGSMKMSIDGQIVKFDRIQASGQEFYGQSTSQVFRNPAGDTTVRVAVSLGQRGEIETVEVREGTVQVLKNGQEVSISVEGDAGC